MKKILLFIILIAAVISAQAQEGFKVKVKFKQPIAEQSLLMGRYFGKAANRLRYDTAYVAKDGSFEFKKTEAIFGGVYFFIFNNNSKSLDFLLDNGYDMEVIIDTLNLIEGTQFKNSKDNELMQAFHIRDMEFRKKNEVAKKQLGMSKSKADSSKVFDDMTQARDVLTKKNRKSAMENPNTLYALVVNALDRPTPPEGKHYKADGKTIDSFYNYRYMKDNFWDKFDLMDDRLAYTPIYEDKLSDYFENYVYPIPDSVQYEADILLAMTRSAPDMFKYTLHWLANYSRTKKVMGMDETFVYLVDKYYANGDATWLDSTQLHKNYLEPAEDLSYTKLGKVGMDLPLFDAYTQMPRNLYSVNADYIIMVFWEPHCGHCQEEIPRIDSVYKALNLKEKNVIIYSIPQDKSLEPIHQMIEKLKVKNEAWLHNIVLNPVNYKAYYGVKMSPTMVILDKDKKIIGKQINYAGIESIINHDIAVKAKNNK